MAGEHQCHYAGWFRSHFSFEVQKRDANLDAWTAEHTAMVHDVAAELRSEGFTVYLEGQNTLKVRGQGGAMLVGKPDLIAVKGDTATVIDCKTGQANVRDTLQIRLYMYLLGKWSTHPARRCRRILGEIRYQAGSEATVQLPHAAADGIAELVKRYMNTFISSAPPKPVPSYRECRFCDLGKAFCPDRIGDEVTITETSLF